MEHVLRAWLIAARLGDHVGTEADGRESLYYVVTLAWVGCVADTPQVAKWFGDDIAFRRRQLRGRSGGPSHDGLHASARGIRESSAAPASPGGEPDGQRAAWPSNGGSCRTASRRPRWLSGSGSAVRCASRSDRSSHAGTAGVCLPAWQGKGSHYRRGCSTSRTAWRCSTARGGVDGAIELARTRRGKQLDPDVVDAFCRAAGEVLADLDAVADWDALIEREPALQRRLSCTELDRALEAVGDFTDLRSRCRAGHSAVLPPCPSSAAELCGLPADEVTNLRRAALVHDVGMHGVPATIIDKPDALTAPRSERMRMHSYYTERMLARPAALARIGAVADARPTNGSTAPGTTEACRGQPSPPRGGSSRPPTRTRP